MINIKGLDKAEVLKELYNNSKVQGLGFLQATNKPMTTDESRLLLEKGTYFDYLYGIMKIDLTSDLEFDERLYDRDNGEGKAEKVISVLRNISK